MNAVNWWRMQVERLMAPGRNTNCPQVSPSPRCCSNLHRAAACSSQRVIVIEGFFDCLKVHQAGQSCVMGLMGCSLSAEQEKFLLQRFRSIVLMLDADPAGRQASLSITARLIQRSTLDVVYLSSGQQPDQMSSQGIQRALSAAVRRVSGNSKTARS